MNLDAMQTARIAIGVVLAVGMLIWLDGLLRNRRRRARFAALAQSFGSQVVREGEFLARFTAVVEDRSFEIRDEHLGPPLRGYFLVAAAPLAGAGWAMHEVEIQRGSMRRRVLRALNVTTLRSGDEAFDERFSVSETGVPVRLGWLDSHVRSAITQFYESRLSLDRLVIQDGQLIHRARAPWKQFDATALRELLVRQSAVAAALESSARGAPRP